MGRRAVPGEPLCTLTAQGPGWKKTGVLEAESTSHRSISLAESRASSSSFPH